MSALAIVRAIAILFSGLFAGILLGDRMGVSFARPVLPASSFVQLQQIIHRYFRRMMPVLLLAGIAAGLGWLVLIRGQWNGAEFWLVAPAAGAMICAAAMTRAINVPINTQLMTWSVANPPSNLREIWSRWERVHTVRTILCVGAFALEVIALSIFTPPRS